MGITLSGLLALALAPSYATVLAAAALMGIGSAVFHPESSRVARMASGGQHGMAQSLFQVGGNAGSALGPLLAAFVSPRDNRVSRGCRFWLSLGLSCSQNIGAWTKHQNHYFTKNPSRRIPPLSAANAAGGMPTRLAHRQNSALSCHSRGGSHVFQSFSTWPV